MIFDKNYDFLSHSTKNYFILESRRFAKLKI